MPPNQALQQGMGRCRACTAVVWKCVEGEGKDDSTCHMNRGGGLALFDITLLWTRCKDNPRLLGKDKRKHAIFLGNPLSSFALIVLWCQGARPWLGQRCSRPSCVRSSPPPRGTSRSGPCRGFGQAGEVNLRITKELFHITKSEPAISLATEFSGLQLYCLTYFLIKMMKRLYMPQNPWPEDPSSASEGVSAVHPLQHR